MSHFKSLIVIYFVLILFVSFSCKENNDSFAYYTIQGTVVDEVSKKPIPDILVIRQPTDYLLFADSTFTDSIGKYDFEFTDYYKESPTFKIQLVDVDGGFNLGEFESKAVNVTFSGVNWLDIPLDGDYIGEASIVTNVEMKLLNE